MLVVFFPISQIIFSTVHKKFGLVVARDVGAHGNGKGDVSGGVHGFGIKFFGFGEIGFIHESFKIKSGPEREGLARVNA